jgi:HPt (histidine-containing phosphotransfer) domain-containing protein
MPDDGKGPIDEAVFADLLESTGGDPEFLAELIDIYLDDAPRQVAAMREAARNGRTEGIVQPAHTLKGASASLGAANLAELSRALELAARVGAVDDAADAVDGIEAELGRVRGALLARKPG